MQARFLEKRNPVVMFLVREYECAKRHLSYRNVILLRIGLMTVSIVGIANHFHRRDPNAVVATVARQPPRG